MPLVHANGLDLYYEDRSAHSRVPLLCIGGLAMDTRFWQFQNTAWEAHYRTITFDNRDVGQSTKVTAGYSVRDMARDALALADALRLEHFHLLGYSLGGAIAQEVALAAGSRVTSLTLCVTFPRATTWLRKLTAMWAERAPTMSFANRIEELLLYSFTDDYYASLMMMLVRQQVLADPHPQPADAFARQLLAIGTHNPLVPLATLRMPVHVIGGERDQLVPIWRVEDLASQIPGARFTVLARAPHGLNIERWLDFNPLVLSFLNAHP